MGIIDNVVKFSIKKNLTKWAKGGATALISLGAPILADKAGVTLTEEQKIALITATGSAILGIANILKIKFPTQFGWL